MHQLFERQVAAAGDAVAVVHGDHLVTYRGLQLRANRWARQLQALGVGPEIMVGVHLGRTPEMVAALLGILMAGGAYVPLDPGYPRERIDYIIADAAMPVVVSDKQQPSKLAQYGIRVLGPGAEAGRPAGATRGRANACPMNLAYVLYTSGSTGHPKGVAITHANAVDLLHWTAEAFGADLARVLASTSICFDCSILEIFGPLSWGGTVVLADSPIDIGARAGGSRVRLIHTVPSVANDLMPSDRLPDTVRTAIVGGEALLPGVVEKLYEGSSIDRLVNLYGPAECTSYASMAVVERSVSGIPPIGRPVANTQIYLLGIAGEPVAPGQPGEMCIAGNGVVRGYLHRPSLTARQFMPEPFSGRSGKRMYRSGDLGLYDADQRVLRFMGRVDEQVKVRGVRIEPEEVERALLEHPGIREAAVCAPADQDGRCALAGYVVPVTVGTIRPASLRSFLRGKLPSSLVPEFFTILDQLPRTPNGKVDRRKLTTMPVVPCDEPVAEPASGLERVIARLWAEAIEIEQVDVHTDVFDLGAHSLAALRVHAKLPELLGEEIPLRMFFEEPTVAGLAAEIGRRLGPRSLPSQDAASSVRWPPSATDRGALSPTQHAILARADKQPDDPGLLFHMVVRLPGQLNAAALKQAFTLLVSRHEILQTAIVTPLGKPPRSGILPDSRLASGSQCPLQFVDLRSVEQAQREDVARRLAAMLIAGPLDVRAGPPLRAMLLRIDDGEHVLAFVLHHIAGDPWSVSRLSVEVMALYAAAIHGRPAALPPPVQYVDWAGEQQRRLESVAGQAQRRFWRSQLRDLPVLRLPGDHHRAGATGEIVNEVFMVPAPLAQQLGDVGRAERATLYMTLLTAFAVLLHRWTGQTELAIGCPELGRVRPELATVIGPCMDARVIRCNLSGDPSFRALLRRVKRQALNAYAANEVPFTTLAAGCRAEPTRHPLFQACITLHEWPSLLDLEYGNALLSQQPIGDLRIEGFLGYAQGVTATDVDLTIFHHKDELKVILVCRGDVVTDSEALDRAACLLGIFREVVAQPDISLSQLMPSRHTKSVN